MIKKSISNNGTKIHNKFLALSVALSLLLNFAVPVSAAEISSHTFDSQDSAVHDSTALFTSFTMATAPVVTYVTTLAAIGDSVSATSSEAGTLYLVPKQGENYTTKEALDSAVDTASAECEPDTPTVMDTSGLSSGIYQIYAVNGEETVSTPSSDVEYATGTGSKADPYQIPSKAVLKRFAEKVNAGNPYNGKYFTQTNDIDLNSEAWTPIGYMMGSGYGNGWYGSNGGFQGNYDGCDHTISNLQVATVTQPGGTDARHPAGLFGAVGRRSDSTNSAIYTPSRIENVHLLNVNVSTTAGNNNYLGALIGEGSCVVLNCSAVGGNGVKINAITGGCGGLVGATWTNSDVVNCYTNLPVSCPSGGAGGMVNCIGDHTIVVNCFARGNITCSGTGSSAGGGGMANWNFANISNCYATGTVNGALLPLCQDTTVPGFAVVSMSTYYLSLHEGETVTNRRGVGTLEATMKSQNFVNTLNINRNCVTGLMPADIVLYNWKIVAGKNDGYPILVKPDANDVTVGVAADANAVYSGGDGTEATPYEISTADDLIQLAVNVNSGTVDTTDQHYKLTSDIDLNGGVWTPIGLSDSTAFDGSFNFNGNTITDYTVSDSTGISGDYGGLFGPLGANGTVAGYEAVISGNVGSPGTTLTYGTGESVTSDALGNYSFTVPYGWTGTVTPGKTGYTFSPAHKDYTSVSSNQSDQNYTFSLPPVAGSGNALRFDGADDYVSMPSDSEHTTAAFSVEAWVQYNTNQSYSGIVDKGRNIGKNWYILSADGSSRGVVVGIEGKELTYNWDDDGWHHVCASYDGSNFFLYVDGVLRGSRPVAGYAPVDSTITFGRRQTPEISDWRYYAGALDEVQIWNAARTQAQIQSDMFRRPSSAETELAGYWDLDEIAGGTASDTSSGNTDGTLNNMDTTAAWVPSEAWRERTTKENTDITMDAGYAPGGGNITLSQMSEPSHGTLSFDNNAKTATYTPNMNWFGSDEFTYEVANASGDSSIYTVDMTVTANINTVTVENNGNGTASASPASAAQGATVTLSAVPNSGYHFKEWQAISPSSLMIGSGNTFTMPGEAVTVKAIFEANPATTYAVTFDLAGGTRTGGGELVQTVVKGTSAAAPTATLSSYTFNGWDKDFSNVTDNLTVTAKWTYKGSGHSGSGSSNNGSDQNNVSSGESSSSGNTDTKDITVVETPQGIDDPQKISVTPVGDAFDQSVEVRLKDNPVMESTIRNYLVNNISKSASETWHIFPLDISMYIKGTDVKVQPKDGTAVTISYPVPSMFLADQSKLVVVCLIDGILQVLPTTMVMKNGMPYVEFTAKHFSPYAFVVDQDGKLLAAGSSTSKSSEPAVPQTGIPTQPRTIPVKPYGLENVPKTGDSGSKELAIGILGLFSLFVSLALNRRRKNI